MNGYRFLMVFLIGLTIYLAWTMRNIRSDNLVLEGYINAIHENLHLDCKGQYITHSIIDFKEDETKMLKGIYFFDDLVTSLENGSHVKLTLKPSQKTEGNSTCGGRPGFCLTGDQLFDLVKIEKIN